MATKQQIDAFAHRAEQYRLAGVRLAETRAAIPVEEAKYNEAQTRRFEAESELRAVRDALATAQRELDLVARATSAEQERIGQLETQAQRAEQELENLENQIRLARGDRAAIVEKVVELDDKVFDLSMSVGDATFDSDDIRVDVEQLKADVDQLKPKPKRRAEPPADEWDQ